MKTHVSRRQLVDALIYWVLFLGLDIVANALFSHVSLLRCVIVGCLGLVLSFGVMMSARPAVGYTERAGSPLRHWRTGLICGAVMLACWLALYGVYFPMVGMNDTMASIAQPIVHADQHPLAYNVLLAGMTRVSDHLFGSYLVGILVFVAMQLLVWTVVAASGCAYLRWLGASPVAIALVVAWFGLNPMIGDYAFATVKDALWAPFVIAIALLSHYAVVSRGREGALGWLYWVAVAISLIGFMVFRNNAIAIAIFVVIALLIWTRKHWRVAVPILVCAFIIGLMPSQMAVHLGKKQKLTEAVAVPLASIAYTYTNDPACIPAASNAYFSQIMTAEDWVELYTPTSVDAIKGTGKYNYDVVEGDRARFLKEWLSFASACPADVGHAYVIYTQGGWRLDPPSLGADHQSYFTAIVSKGCGFDGCQDECAKVVTEHGVVTRPWWPPQVVKAVDDFGHWLASGRMGKTGPWTWVVFLILMGFLSRRRVAEALALLGPAILVWGSLMAATPTFHPFRYFEFSVGLCAFAAAILMATPSVAAIRAQASAESTQTIGSSVEGADEVE